MNVKQAVARLFRCGGRANKKGMTLTEVLVAMCLTTLMCGGLYTVGLKAREVAECDRLATEARSLARERLEEMISVGRLNLAKETCTLPNASTHQSSLGYTITRQPRIVWHAADRTVVAAADSVYAELHVDVTYKPPTRDSLVTDTYSSIIE